MTEISVRDEQRVTVGFAETEITVDCCFRLKRKKPQVSAKHTLTHAKSVAGDALMYIAAHLYE